MTAVRRPATAATVVGLLVALLWWQLLWSPQSAALAAAHRHRAEASNALFQAGQRLGHLKHLSTQSADLVALDQRVAAAIPPGDDLDGFLLSLNAMAQASGVTVRSLTPTAPAAAPNGLSSMSVLITVEGGYFDVQRLLDLLKGGGRLVVVDALTEAPAGGAAGGGSKISARISAHILSGLPVAVPVPAPVPAPVPVSK